jgi:C4-dicarboxylate-specific signal transduction histidine kinase/ABC-type uncharacterized transport system substrate-binding protein
VTDRNTHPLRWLVCLGLVLALAGGAPIPTGSARLASATPSEPNAVRRVLLLNVVPRSTPALVALEQAFTSTLKAEVPDRIAFNSEYVDLAMFEEKEHFEKELVAYLAAKYARTKLDLVVITGTASVAFTLHHRARLFPGVPIVFMSVVKRAVADVPLDPDVTGVWLPIDFTGTLAAAQRLQPDLQQAVVINGASPLERLTWANEARAQLREASVPVTYLDNMSFEEVLARVSALPPRTVVLLGTFLTDVNGRRFVPPESTARISAASSVPVYTTIGMQLGHGAVGGHVLSFDRQGRQGAALAARVLRGERPPPVDAETLAYRFDARQLKRWGLDASRLPPGSTIEFDERTLWQTYGGYIVAGLAALALQSWMIIGLLKSRAERRRAQAELAGRLRFEMLVSELLAAELKSPAERTDAETHRVLAQIGADLEVDRILLSIRDAPRRSSTVIHMWKRDDVPEVPQTVQWTAFPWMSASLGERRVVAVSGLAALPPEAAIDRESLLKIGTRSVLAIPLIADKGLLGVLSCASVRHERDWPPALIERLQLLAEVFASMLTRRRAEAAARASEEQLQQKNQELSHALRVNTLGELGASLAHELNQPLSAILINARTLAALLQRGTGNEKIMAEALADIMADTKRAGDIIERLRALSRKEHAPERGLRLGALVDEVVSLLHQDFVRRSIVVTHIAEPKLPRVTGDRIQLQQIFLNLLVNASEALEGTARGRREITITTTRPAVGLVEVAVTDSGVGSKDVDTERMFESFVTTKSGGLGMGLAISRSIAAAHGGRIYAKANVDRGLTVFVELPAEP